MLVLYGDDPIASNNLLLGQFDVINIPPAPKDVPRIEVTFRLSKDMVLTAEAARQKVAELTYRVRYLSCRFCRDRRQLSPLDNLQSH